MSIVKQYSTETADTEGDVVFAFPAPPQGGTWSGSLAIPGAPPTAAGMVMIGGSLGGALNGAGFFGPFVALAGEVLSISCTGLTPGVQYQAVWHTDTETAVTPSPTPAVAVIGIGGAGIAGAGTGVNTLTATLAAGDSGPITGLPDTFTIWELGWFTDGPTSPSSGAVSFLITGVTVGVLETVTFEEGGSSRLAGLAATNMGVVATNNTNETLLAFVTYSAR